MSIEKMREEFEAAYRAQAVERYEKEPDSAVFNYHCGEYVLGYVQSAWWGWQASRAELVIELPERLTEGDDYAEGWNHALTLAGGAVRGAGVRVKS